ncbi:hypothetical protein B296_00049020 [Ensete ventricosum]|uniref:Uncharacterized protein n=1 Tax=Ensete ventricosum TaxID=4639 RepID=A0A426YJ30_ENSVE|nr:hypothetical protein B296_00049020 [Ensete ventricosum]
MGEAELDILPLLEAAKMDLAGVPDSSIIKTVKPGRQNCLVGESHIKWMGGKLVQDIILRLRNVECGEVELQLTWVKNSGLSWKKKKPPVMVFCSDHSLHWQSEEEHVEHYLCFTVSPSNCAGRPPAIQQQRHDGDLAVDDVGHRERFRCGCLFLLALSHKKKHALPRVGGSQVAVEADQAGQESTGEESAGTASRAASLEKFECESWSSSAILDGDVDGNDDGLQSYFDLPLELIRSSRNGANSPVKAAFVFESDRKGSLKRSMSKLAPRKSHELSNRHVKFSTSPASYPASPSSYCIISPRMQKATEEFHAFLEARNA